MKGETMVRCIGWIIASCVFLAYQLSFCQVPAGAGSYVTAGTFTVPPVTPFVTPDFSQKVISAKWWGTLLTMQYSYPMFAHPLSFQAQSAGLDIGYPGAPTGSGGDFASAHVRDLTVGISGMNAPSALVASYSDFAVKGRWTSGSSVMEATMAQGIPFVYFKITGGSASIAWRGTPTIWYNQAGTMGITVGTRTYGVFAPSGSVWSGTGTMTSTLSGKDYLSVALLPENTQTALDFFKRYAYSFVKETRVSWKYDSTGGLLVSTFAVVTEAREGTDSGTVFALMRHQWLYSSATFSPYTYQSARGVMKVTSGQSFSTIDKFNGILLSMPDTGFDPATMKTLVQNENSPSTIIGSTYNKDFGKWSQLVQIADMAGNTAKRDQFLASLKSGLQEWFTSGSSAQFYYNQTWNRLIGYPAAFGSDSRLADHHFHYGYFVKAAAIVAQWDKQWASQSKWGAMVEMLIRDVNTWDDSDPLFGRFAYFEPYEGHGWADGLGFARGDNQESSSEAMNFNAAVILWGIMTGNPTIRDMGIFMYVNEARAIEQYWWDVNNVTFPSGFAHTAVGMVWSNGGAYSTWFSGNTGAIHGINMLPNTAGHLYYGRCPDYIPLNYNEGFSGQWPDLFYEFLAYSDAATALQRYSASTSIEGGNTRAACYLELTSLATVGRLDTQVVGSVPSFAVFDKGNVRTYCAYNPDLTDKTVTFNDGFSMLVPAGKQIHRTDAAKPIHTFAPLGALKSKPCFFPNMKIFAAGGSIRFPAFPDNVGAVALYDLCGKKLWESDVAKGRCVRLNGSLRLPARGVYMLKQVQ
jgi:endoglucanase Acf2